MLDALPSLDAPREPASTRTVEKPRPVNVDEYDIWKD
jgi:hypothetical protein